MGSRFSGATKPWRLDAEGPLCTFIRVKDASSTVATTFVSPCPCSAIGGGEQERVNSECNGRDQSLCRSCFGRERGYELAQRIDRGRGLGDCAYLMDPIIGGSDASGAGRDKLAADLDEGVA